MKIEYDINYLQCEGENQMQQYPLIGISGNHRQDNTEQDPYLLSYAPNGFVTGLEKSKSHSSNLTDCFSRNSSRIYFKS